MFSTLGFPFQYLLMILFEFLYFYYFYLQWHCRLLFHEGFFCFLCVFHSVQFYFHFVFSSLHFVHKLTLVKKQLLIFCIQDLNLKPSLGWMVQTERLVCLKYNDLHKHAVLNSFLQAEMGLNLCDWFFITIYRTSVEF